MFGHIRIRGSPASLFDFDLYSCFNDFGQLPIDLKSKP